MSIPAFAWAMEQGAVRELLPADRLVLIFLADQANGDLVCWPGQPMIERFTGLGNNTVRAAIHRLASLQLISVITAAGKVTRYRLLRPATPANGASPANDALVATPANGGGVTPANEMGAPPQTDGGHPLKLEATPPQVGGHTPANRSTDPSSPKNLTPKTRAPAREASQEDSKIREKQEESIAPAPVPKATTTSGAPKLVADPNAEDPLDRPVDPEAFKQLAANIARRWQNNYPPREAERSRDEQIQACSTPKAYHLPDAVLRYERIRLAEQTRAVRGSL